MNFTDLKKRLTGDLTEYKSIPFWSWNNRIDKNELIKQIEEMHSVEIGGFIMHARAGLKGVEYLSDGWFDCIEACLDKAKQLNMEAWIYDENGWPSGIAGGKLLKNKDYLATYLRMEEQNFFDKEAFAVFVKVNGKYRRIEENTDSGVYYCVYKNTVQSYTDILNPEVVDAFISETHEKYYKRFGNRFGKELVGFFTDEPQCCPGGIPYSKCIEEEFEKKGKEIRDYLIYLFSDDEEGYRFKYEYYSVMNDLYVHNYYEKIYHWCSEHNCKLTGHSMNEELLSYQVRSCGGVAPSYEYEHIPAVDWLGRKCEMFLPFRQISSVATQLNKKTVLSETFGCAGYNITPKELKSNAEFQYFNGVNKLCQHLYPYSLASQGKYDCPPVFSRPSNWFEGFKEFNIYFNRLGYVIAKTREDESIAILNPIKSLYLRYVKNNIQKLSESADGKFEELLNYLAFNGVSYHIIDETLLSKYGKTDGNSLVVGNCKYTTLIIPESEGISAETYGILKRYKGNLYVEGEIKYVNGERVKTDIVSNVGIDYILGQRKYGFDLKEGKGFITERKGEAGDFLFVKNISKDLPCRISLKNVSENFMALDLGSLTLKNITDEFYLNGAESVILYKTENAKPYENKDNYESIDITDNFRLDSVTENYFVLDKAEYSIDGVRFSDSKDLREIFDFLVREKYCGDLIVRQSFYVNDLFKAKILIENANYKDIRLNGKGLSFYKSDFDLLFSESDITEFLKKGENVFEYRLDFYERDEVRYALFDEKATANIKNCLYYDTSLENAYIKGDFIVEKDFSLSERKLPLGTFADMQNNGYPFFYGDIKLKGIIEYSGAGPSVLSLEGQFLMAEIKCNEVKTNFVFDKKADISTLLKKGKNEVEITVKSSLRNLFGPHHSKLDLENVNVFSSHFNPVGSWKNGPPDNYTEKYNSVKFGVDKIYVTT